MFVEMLVISVASRFGSKLGERWLDALVELADQRTRELLKRLFEDPSDQWTQEELVAHLEEDPVEADKLMAHAAPELKLAPTKIDRVRHFVWILNWVLARRRPRAPGRAPRLPERP